MKNVIYLPLLILCCCQQSKNQVNTASGGAGSKPAIAHAPVIEMVAVESGIYTMGCTFAPGECKDTELPVHPVKVNDFFIGKYEVTQAQWEAVMGNNPSRFKGENYPVDQVSWDDVQEFIAKLNELTGKQYRLPTEGEWEFAARGGKNSKGYKYSGSNTAGDVAWLDSNSEKTTHAVGTKEPNELGIYDMSGNVMEWVNDWLGKYTEDDKLDPKGAKSGTLRVGRGGSWGSNERAVIVSTRTGNKPETRAINLGFRLAHSAE